MKKYINTVIYWLSPQSGQIACLKAKVKAQEDLSVGEKAMMFPKTKVWRSERYRRFVASLPCCVCLTPGSNAHHEQLNGGKMGGKESDEFCIPLCPWHHFYRHNSPLGKRVWETWGKDPVEIIRQTQAEWARRGNKAEWQQ